MAEQREGRQFVSRAGFKLDHALREFKLDVTGLSCADFGCNIGGFTDCLLQRGAAKVYAIDTGYGTLAYKLRTDPRVVVMERTNALHAPPPKTEAQNASGADLVTIDLAWTPQRFSIPAALKWLKSSGRIITLVKPHYELEEAEKRVLLVDGRLEARHAEPIVRRVLDAMPQWGARPVGHTLSPITGGKSSQSAGGKGNVEYLVLVEPITNRDRVGPGEA